MKLINNTKSKFITSKGDFLIGKVIDFGKEESKTLLRYEGIESLESLESKESKSKAKLKAAPSEHDLLKEEAKSLGIEFSSNISSAKLTELIEEAKTAPDSKGD